RSATNGSAELQLLGQFDDLVGGFTAHHLLEQVPRVPGRTRASGRILPHALPTIELCFLADRGLDFFYRGLKARFFCSGKSGLDFLNGYLDRILRRGIDSRATHATGSQRKKYRSHGDDAHNLTHAINAHITPLKFRYKAGSNSR